MYSQPATTDPSVRWTGFRRRVRGSLRVDAIGCTLMRAFHPPTYGAPDYRAHARVTAEELEGRADQLTHRLLSPLFEVIAERGYDPLNDQRR